MSEKRASLARLNSSSSASSQRSEGEADDNLQTTLDAIISPSRLAALEAADVAPIHYNTYSFFSYILSVRGRNLQMVIPALLALLLFGLGWQLLFFYADGDGEVQEYLASLDELITPLITPLSFMLTFRLGRAAVRFWDARRAAGKMVEICRANIAIVSVGLISPIGLRKRRMQKQQTNRHIAETPQGGESNLKTSDSKNNQLNNQSEKRIIRTHTFDSIDNGSSQDSSDKFFSLHDTSIDDNDGFLGDIVFEGNHPNLKFDEPNPQASKAQDHKNANNDGANENNGAEELDILCEYARWLTVFPIAVKHFLRSVARKGWKADGRYKKRRYEIGPLLSDKDAQNVIMVYDDENGKPTFDSKVGTKARDPPLVVLNRLHGLAYEIAHLSRSGDPSSVSPTPQGQAIFYQQVTDQLNILYGAYGAMERIKGTPLPFAYAIHLRTFLLLYLFLWNMVMIAKYEWESLPFLFLLNWALLGIEAAAVECEQPFGYNTNHLTLGKVSVVIARNIAQALKETNERFLLTD